MILNHKNEVGSVNPHCPPFCSKKHKDKGTQRSTAQ